MTGSYRKQLLALSFQIQKPLLVAEAFVFVAPASRRLSRGRLALALVAYFTFRKMIAKV